MWFVAISMALAALDQLSKRAITEALPLCVQGQCESIVLLPVLEFVRLHNDGAAFSFLADQGGWQRWFLLFVSSAVSLLIVVWLSRVRDNLILTIALTLILGGALGNLFDRAVYGYVVDFVLVHYQDWYFPAFNLADSCISVGAAFLILDMFRSPKAGERLEQEGTD
jgi:signal peptidase II